MARQRFETLRSLKLSKPNSTSNSSLAGHPTGCLKGLSSDFVEAFIREADVELFSAGDVIMKDVASGSDIFVLLCGSVDVLQGRRPSRTPWRFQATQKIATLGEGSFLGGMSCLGLNVQEACTVVANEFCDCRRMVAQQFKALLRRYPAAKSHFARIIEERNEELLLDLVNPMAERLADLAGSSLVLSVDSATTPTDLHAPSSLSSPIKVPFHKVNSPAEAPPRGKPGSVFRKCHRTSLASQESLETVAPSSRPTSLSSLELLETCAPPSRADSKESCIADSSGYSSDAPLSVGKTPPITSSRASSCSDRVSLPDFSPPSDRGRDWQRSLKAVMRTKNDALRLQIRQAHTDLIGTTVPSSDRDGDWRRSLKANAPTVPVRKDENGFRTAPAKEYPEGLNKALAEAAISHCCRNSTAQQIDRSEGPHLSGDLSRFYSTFEEGQEVAQFGPDFAGRELPT